MTKNRLKANRAIWEQDLAAYRRARVELEEHDHRANPTDTDAIYERCALAEEKVLDQLAPDIGAVADKLMILWDEAVWSGLQEGEQMRQIIGDLRRLAQFHG